MPLAPWSGYATLACLVAVVVLLGFDRPIGTWTVASIAVIVPGLIGGWYLARRRVTAVAEERLGFTGSFPVVMRSPLQDRIGTNNARDGEIA